ncbi:MAG TPA: GntR family transcriptional regulator [Paraburkholderia sp.]|nr:GntR family transcriptional regulator [Paraburkholderia sp.]
MTRRASATTVVKAAAAGRAPQSLAGSDARLRYRLIHDQLKSAIAHGRITPGLVLLEGPVARIFGTSREPVRKAFEMLHAGGLLHTFDGRGYLAARPDGSAAAPVRMPLSEAALGFAEPPQPLDTRSHSERIYEQLEAAISLGIVFGHFRIDESHAAESFGVSRGTVREALSRLRDLGLVEKSAYSHWLCGPLTARAVAEDYELRALLEPAALTAAARAIPAERLQAARAELEQAIADPDSIDAAALYRLEMTLHADFLHYAPNRKLRETIGRAHLPLTVNHAFYEAFKLHPERGTLLEHRAVLEQLSRGDVAAAAQALADHLRAGQKRTLQRLKVMAVLPEPQLPVYMQRIA